MYTSLPRTKVFKKCMAKALYDNIAESPDELAFRKGDILTVLEQNTQGLEGWWLCSLRGRQGLVPGNRVHLMPSVRPENTSVDQVDGADNFPYTESTQGLRRSWHADSKKVATVSYDVPENVKASQDYDVPRCLNCSESKKRQIYYDLLDSLGDYDIPPNIGIPDALTTPKGVCKHDSTASSDSDVYDIPRNATNLYDVPNVIHYDVPDGLMQSAKSLLKDKNDDYDIPPSKPQPVHNIHELSHQWDSKHLMTPSECSTPPSSRPISTTSSHSSQCRSSSNRSSIEQKQELYDIPVSDFRQFGIRSTTDRKSSPHSSFINNSNQYLAHAESLYNAPPNNAPVKSSSQHTSPEETTKFYIQGLYDIPPQVTRDPNSSANKHSVSSDEIQHLLSSCIVGKELPLEHQDAVELCAKRHKEVHSTIKTLFECLKNKQNNREVHSFCLKLKTTVYEFIELALGALANCIHSPDKGLATKLSKLLKPLVESSTYIRSITNLECYSPEELEKIVDCARSLTEDVKLVAYFICGNSSLIFKRSNTERTGNGDILSNEPKEDKINSSNPSNVDNKSLLDGFLTSGHSTDGIVEDRKSDQEWLNQYDYVGIQSGVVIKKENKDIKDDVPKEMHDICRNQVSKHIETERNLQFEVNELDRNDYMLLGFYKHQIDEEIVNLTNLIGVLLAKIRSKQPPKIFIGYCKFVIISASKLIYIGDTISINVYDEDIKTSVIQKSNGLSDAIKNLVADAKKAASLFPSAFANHEMITSICDVSHKASDLKVAIGKHL
ncbi:breast cancer anti-estrogen resistance protein 1-like isoform X2 [Limulus polyphemus]|uniref:Breast cancer anti-estrogen resistance protein 1-like isoform X2 n=1 Tax=Limulus polyphemus TaxID=6850 RepID=A0ABM1SF71_LIMPO|nr:breast cancer anti-estrogen resistance protein 1-like isoform X2 [Limulus polyphemus]